MSSSSRELIRIALSTGIIHSVFWSTFIYSAEITGVLSLSTGVYEAILIGSILWGMFGAASVLRRERDSIKIHLLDRLAESYLGIDSAGKDIMAAFLNYCWFPHAKMPKIKKY